MSLQSKIIDRQVGRNAELLAHAIAKLESPEERYPYLRILTSIIEQAHPEWRVVPQKSHRIAQLIRRMMGPVIEVDEIVETVKVRDAERGYFHD